MLKRGLILIFLEWVSWRVCSKALWSVPGTFQEVPFKELQSNMLFEGNCL